MKISRLEELLEFIVQNGDENTFLSLRIAIQIMLTIPQVKTNAFVFESLYESRQTVIWLYWKRRN